MFLLVEIEKFVISWNTGRFMSEPYVAGHAAGIYADKCLTALLLI
jgi:hypothetical protein